MKTQKQIYQELEDLNKDQSYWSTNKKVAYFRESSDDLLKLIKQVPHKRILEVGCSDGAFTKELVKIADRVVGIDVSKSEIKRAKKNCPEAMFIAMSLDDYARYLAIYPKMPEKFDVIICAEVLYYIKNADRAIVELQFLGNYLVTSHFVACLPQVSLSAFLWEWRLRIFPRLDRIIEKSWKEKLLVVKTLRKL